MSENPREDIAILQKVGNEKFISSYQETKNIMEYFKQVEQAKKELKATHPEIPEDELELYL